jgi:hypothetical protein
MDIIDFKKAKMIDDKINFINRVFDYLEANDGKVFSELEDCTTEEAFSEINEILKESILSILEPIRSSYQREFESI